MSVQSIYKTEKIITVTPNEKLSKTLAQLSSSHDAAFVFEEDRDKSGKRTFLGIINPYYCMVVKSYPASTRVKHSLVHPPKLAVGDSLEKAARLMIESKIHYLPIMENNEFVGIITARRLIGYANETGATRVKVSAHNKDKRSLVSVFENDPLSKALSYFKEHKTSKLIVLSKDMRLKGIITFYDLLPYVNQPRQRQGMGARVGNTEPLLNKPVKHFMKSQVITISMQHSLTEAARLILEQEIGSVIVVDKGNHPVGIITTRDILRLLAPAKRSTKLEFNIQNLPKKSMHFVHQFIGGVNNYLSKFPDVKSAKFTLKGARMGGVFEAVLSVFRKGEKPTVIKKEGKNLKKVLQEVKKTEKNALK